VISSCRLPHAAYSPRAGSGLFNATGLCSRLRWTHCLILTAMSTLVSADGVVEQGSIPPLVPARKVWEPSRSDRCTAGNSLRGEVGPDACSRESTAPMAYFRDPRSISRGSSRRHACRGGMWPTRLRLATPKLGRLSTSAILPRLSTRNCLRPHWRRSTSDCPS